MISRADQIADLKAELRDTILRGDKAEEKTIRTKLDRLTRGRENTVTAPDETRS